MNTTVWFSVERVLPVIYYFLACRHHFPSTDSGALTCLGRLGSKRGMCAE